METIKSKVSILDMDDVFKVNKELKKEYSGRTVTIATIISVMLLFTVTVKAAPPDLALLFETEAFQGSWEVVQKLNWVGMVLNWIISIFCALGLFIIFAERILTIFYKSAQNIFDQVHEIKGGSQSNNDFLGFRTIADNAMKRNGIFDFVIYILLALCPDIKAITVYNDTSGTNYDDSDTVGLYMMKCFAPTVCSCFFLTIGASGTLAKGYGTVVSAMATFADNVVSVNLDVYVDKLFSISSNPEYTLGLDGSNKGKVQKKVATFLYREAQKVANITDKDAKAILLANCEEVALEICNESSSAIIASLGESPVSDDDWGRLQPRHSSNKSSSISTESTTDVELSRVLPEYSGGTVVHITYSSSKPTHNYINVPEEAYQ